MSDTPSMEARSTRNLLISSYPHSKVTIDVAISERMELVLAKLIQCLLWLKACGRMLSLSTHEIHATSRKNGFLNKILMTGHQRKSPRLQERSDPGDTRPRGPERQRRWPTDYSKGFFFFFFWKKILPFFKALMVFKFQFKFFLRVGGSCHSSKQSSILFPGKSAFCPDHAGQDQSWEAGASRTFQDLTR